MVASERTQKKGGRDMLGKAKPRLLSTETGARTEQEGRPGTIAAVKPLRFRGFEALGFLFPILPFWGKGRKLLNEAAVREQLAEVRKALGTMDKERLALQSIEKSLIAWLDLHSGRPSEPGKSPGRP